MRANTSSTVNSLITNIYDKQINDALTTMFNYNPVIKPLSYYEATGQSTMEWHTINTSGSITTNLPRKEEKMNISAGFARVKGGYLAQVAENGAIIWESKKRYRTSGKAIEAAQQKINKTIDILFNK